MDIRATTFPFRSVILLSTPFFLIFLVGCSTLEQRKSLLNREIWSASSSIRPFTGDPMTLYHQGVPYQGRGQHKLAIDAFRQVLQADPRNIKAINAMAVLFDKLEDFEEALALYHAVLSQNSELDYIHTNLGYSYLLQDKPGLAIQSFEHALTLAPESRRYRNNLGIAHARQGNFDAALALFSPSPAQMAPGQGADTISEHIPAQMESPAPRSHHAADQAIPAALTKRDRKTVITQLDSTGRVDRLARHNGPAGEEGLQARNQRGERYRASKAPSRPLAPLPEVNIINTQPSAQNNPLCGQKPMAIPMRTPGIRDFLSATPIEVYNGNGIQGMAHQVGTHPRNLGYSVTDVANAEHFNYPRTMIFFHEGDLPMAEDLAA